MTSYAEAHKNPQGPGDARPTAQQIIEDNNLLGNLSGKVALITGISSGIGIETARALKSTGMHVFGAVRNMEKARAALEGDLEPGHLELLEMNMNSLASVRACAKEFLSKSNELNVLVANAVRHQSPRTLPALPTAQTHAPGFRDATPYFGSRVIFLSSVGHRGGAFAFSNSDTINFVSKPYDPVAAYAQSKLAAVYMANEIERRFSSRHLHAFSAMPGGIWMGLQASLPETVVSTWQRDADFQKAFKSTEQGAATTIWGAVAKELEGKGGKYLEDCAIAGPAPAPTGDPTADMGAPGYAAWAFDEAREKALWKISCEMVSINED